MGLEMEEDATRGVDLEEKALDGVEEMRAVEAAMVCWELTHSVTHWSRVGVYGLRVLRWRKGMGQWEDK